MTRESRKRSSKIAWGFFWFLLAGLILANALGGFVQLSVWGIIIGAIATVILFHCLATLSFASIPVPIAALYYIFQATLGLPAVGFWTLAAVTVLLTIGLHVILPRRYSSGKFVHIGINEGMRYRKRYTTGGSANSGSADVQDADVIIDGDVESDSSSNSSGGAGGSGNPKDYTEATEKTRIEEGDDANNPYISVSFGYASRYLHADNLESAELNCSFGGMEVYFDNVTLSPNGAEVNINCSFGSIEVYVPSHWRVIDELNTSLANAEVSRRLQSNDPDAPTIRITGSVSLGNAEVKRIKGS